MEKLILRKGNLFHPLENTIDLKLIDSSQYDLEVTLDGKSNYYRIRYNSSYYDAKQIFPNVFSLPKFSSSGVGATEIDEFCKTDLYRSNPNYRKVIGSIRKDNMLPGYFKAMQRISGKKNLNNAKSLYCFSIPALGNRKKIGVLSYDIEIELIRNRYYIVFITENVVRGYLQRTEPQYIIYDRREFEVTRDTMNNSILDLAIHGDYPLNLLEYVYIMTGGDETLIAQFFRILKETRNIQELCCSEFFRIISPKSEIEEEIKREFNRYLAGEQEDIHYSYYKKCYTLEKRG